MHGPGCVLPAVGCVPKLSQHATLVNVRACLAGLQIIHRNGEKWLSGAAMDRKVGGKGEDPVVESRVRGDRNPQKPTEGPRYRFVSSRRKEFGKFQARRE